MSTTITKKMLALCFILVIFITGCAGIVAKAEEIPATTKFSELVGIPTTEIEINVTPTVTYTEPTSTSTPPTPTKVVIETIRVETPSPTQTENLPEYQLPISPTFKVDGSGNKMLFFGEFYRELPLSKNVSEMVIPDSIVIHTDDQNGDFPEKWNTMTTYWGLGELKSVHFAVSQDGIAQMLPMGEVTVKRANGTLEQWDDSGNWVEYDAHSIQIEMGGRNFNYLITGQASPKMIEVIEITTKKTVDLVISLMIFYDIPLENIVGHYQIGRGKTDPGNLYFEQYFLPLLEEEFSKYVQN